MAKRILIAVVALVALVLGTIYTLGSLTDANHVASVRMRLDAPAGELYASIADLEGWTTWSSIATAMEQGEDRDGRPFWVMTSQYGEMPMVVTADRAPSATAPGTLVTEIPSDAGIGFAGTWTYEVGREDGLTVVTLTERGHVESPILRFFSRYLTGYHAGVETFARDLATKHGATPTIERVDAG